MVWYLQADFFCLVTFVVAESTLLVSQIWLLRAAKTGAVRVVYLVSGTSDGRSVSGTGKCC